MWYSTMNAVFRPAVLALLAVLVAACDPASRYRPREWQATDAADRWSSSLDGIRFTSTGIVAGLGATTISSQFDIENGTKYAVVLESAELQANGNTYAGKLPEGEARWRKVEPSAKGYVNVYWQFNAPALDAIGIEPVLLMTFRVNGDTKSMRIEYTRE